MESSKYPEAAFLAAMTASATHEVRNVLAIIKESAGLVDDLVQVQGSQGRLDPEKVQRALERIKVQVRRGADLLTHLNRLAHTLDEDLSRVEMNQEVEQLFFLSQRSARKKGQQLEFQASPEEQHLLVNGLHLQMALSGAMRCCLEELPEGCQVQVRVMQEEGMVVVHFGGSDLDSLQEPPVQCGYSEVLEGMAGALGARVERDPVGYGIRILFSKES
jgi:signal transduction histidine kinase